RPPEEARSRAFSDPSRELVRRQILEGVSAIPDLVALAATPGPASHLALCGLGIRAEPRPDVAARTREALQEGDAIRFLAGGWALARTAPDDELRAFSIAEAIP